MTLTDEQRQKLMQDYSVWEEKYNNKGELIAKNVILPNLAELIYNEFNYHFKTTIDTEEIHYYKNGYYKKKGEVICRQLTEEFLGENTKEHNKNEVTGYIRDKNYVDRDIFEPDINLINLKNGVYNLKTRKFTEHKPEYNFLNIIPVDYNPKIKMKTGKKFFKDVVAPADIPLLQEIFGYCLYRCYHIHKAFMFIGNGSNGKSTVLSLLKIFLGAENVSGIALQDLDTSRFATATLHRKLANIYPDISSNALHKTGKFKMLTGRDVIGAEIKFKDFFNYINYAKLVFSCNKLPVADDDSDAFFRRWVIINFPYIFTGKKCDKKILEKLTTDKELSGILNWALTGLKRILKNGEFTNTQSTDEMREYYQRTSDPIYAFINDNVEYDTNSYITKDDFFTAFCEYCRANRLSPVAKNLFSKRLHEHITVSEYKPSISGKRVYCWLGIRWSKESNMSKQFPILRVCENPYDIKIGNNLDKLDSPDIQEELDV